MKFDEVYGQIAQIARQYQYHQTPDYIVRLQELIKRLVRWLLDLLPSLHINLPATGSDSRMVSDVMQKLLLTAGVLAAIALVFTVWFRLRTVVNQTKIARTGAYAHARELTYQGWKDEAARLAAAGDWRHACRAVYLAFLRLLDEKSVISYSPTKTNFEYWYALAGSKNLQRSFRLITDRVEESWFGDRQAQESDLRACEDSLLKAEELVELSERGAG